MAIYKNDYTKEEDELLWELHNIRNKLHKKWLNKNVFERNEDIKKVFLKRKKEWKEKYKKILK